MESWWTGSVSSAGGQTGVWELDIVRSIQEAWSGRRVLPAIPTLVELCSADQAFPLITNRRALTRPPWPFHSLPWVVSRHNLQRAAGPLPKAGSWCQVLSPSPFLPLRDVEDGHIPLVRRPTAWEKGCACSGVLKDTDNSWIALLAWEHPLPVCPLSIPHPPGSSLSVLCLPSHLKPRPLNGLER